MYSLKVYYHNVATFWSRHAAIKSMQYWFYPDLHPECIRKPLWGPDLYARIASNPTHGNSLAPGRCGSNSKSVTFKHMFKINSMGTSCEFAQRWIPLITFDGKSAFDQVMAYRHLRIW